MNRILLAIDRSGRCDVTGPPASAIHQRRHKILGSGQNENVGFPRIIVLRQAFIGFAGYGWQPDRPAETERTVPRAGVIRKRELWSEFGANFSPIPRIAPPPLGRLNEGSGAAFPDDSGE